MNKKRKNSTAQGKIALPEIQVSKRYYLIRPPPVPTRFLTKKSSKTSILRFERGTHLGTISIFDPKIVENIDFAVQERYDIMVRTSIQIHPVYFNFVRIKFIINFINLT